MKLPIPEAALAQHVIALGKTGSGKSSKLRVLVEWALEQQLPVCILDPKGDWWGLKSSADGKHSGYPIVIFGGDHADVPINRNSGAAIAELTMTGNRPCLIDLRGWMPTDRTRFFIDFASKTFSVTRGRRLLVLPEVHNFAPKGRVLSPEAGEMLHWANRLASESRGLGLTILADSQRPQKVHNDLLTSCETLIACRVIHKADRDAIADWIDGCADPELGKKVLKELAGMKRSDAWVWSPEIQFGPELVNFPLFKTYDSFKPQQIQLIWGKLKGWAEVDLEEVKAKLHTVVAAAEANDPKMLRKRIADLEQQLARAGSRVSDEQIESIRQKAYEEARRQYLQIQLADVAFASDTLKRAARECNEAAAKLEEHGRKQPPEAIPVGPPLRGTAVLRFESKPHTNGHADSPTDPAIGEGGKRRILIALAQNPKGLTQRKLSILVDISPSGGTWRTYMADLRSRGFLAGGKERLSITKEGLEALGRYDPLPTGAALIDYWRRRLGDSGRRAIFDTVVQAYPSTIAKEEVASATNIAIGGGTWRTYLAELRGLALIEGRDELHANADLFS